LHVFHNKLVSKLLLSQQTSIKSHHQFGMKVMIVAGTNWFELNVHASFHWIMALLKF